MNPTLQNYLISFVVFLLTTLVGAAVNLLLTYAKARMGEAKWNTLTNLAGAAKNASDQAIKVSGITNAQALTAAVDTVQAGLDNAKISFPVKTIVSAVESAVKIDNAYKQAVALAVASVPPEPVDSTVYPPEGTHFVGSSPTEVAPSTPPASMVPPIPDEPVGR
jgi:hypothetical protein